MKTVYIETTIFSYLTARPSRDVIVASWQQVTDKWWREHRKRYELFVSAVVKEEAEKGDPEAAERRLLEMSGIPVLDGNQEAERLTERLLVERAVPEGATRDAAHVALAAVHHIDYLPTWNFRHLDNAERKQDIRAVCAIFGYPCPEICTPLELMGETPDEG